MTISKRLKAVAGFVTRGSTLVDVGCDHGLLPVYLVENGIVTHATACDIKEGPLNASRELVKARGLEGKIRCVISDGFKEISPTSYDTATVCGMGGELIASILENSKEHFLSDKHFIFNPMTHSEILRKYLCENGFKIEKDIIICDTGHYYNIFDAHYIGTVTPHREAYYYIGEIRDFSEAGYFEHLLSYLKNKEKSGGDFSKVIAEIEAKL